MRCKMKKKNNNNKREFEQNDEMEEVINPTDFSQKRVSKVSLKNFYNGEGSQRNQLNSAPNYKSLTNKIKKIEEITTILQKAVNTGINAEIPEVKLAQAKDAKIKISAIEIKVALF